MNPRPIPESDQRTQACKRPLLSIEKRLNYSRRAETVLRIHWRIGGAEGNRTPDLVIANDALSRLSYGPECNPIARILAFCQISSSPVGSDMLRHEVVHFASARQSVPTGRNRNPLACNAPQSRNGAKIESNCRSQDCNRHGATTLFAALSTLDGKADGRHSECHRNQEFIEQIEASVPAKEGIRC